jgi:hypothetical protein
LQHKTQNHISGSPPFSTTTTTTTTNLLHTKTITMPSKGQSWWARHCTPRPPINPVVACPCHHCFNMVAEELDYPKSSHSSQASTPAPSRPVSPTGRVSPASSPSVQQVPITTAHIEKAAKQ